MSRASFSSRRSFLKHSTVAGLALGTPSLGRAQAPVPGNRPQALHGLQFGDVVSDSGIVWSRSDRPARMLIEWSTSPSFARSTRVRGPYALEPGDFTARVDLQGLPEDRDIFVKVLFEGLERGRPLGDPVLGQFRTAPRRRRDVRFVWGGDTAGALRDVAGTTVFSQRLSADYCDGFRDD